MGRGRDILILRLNIKKGRLFCKVFLYQNPALRLITCSNPIHLPRLLPPVQIIIIVKPNKKEYIIVSYSISGDTKLGRKMKYGYRGDYDFIVEQILHKH
jgi:hypothetical protein